MDCAVIQVNMFSLEHPADTSVNLLFCDQISELLFYYCQWVGDFFLFPLKNSHIKTISTLILKIITQLKDLYLGIFLKRMEEKSYCSSHHVFCD